MCVWVCYSGLQHIRPKKSHLFFADTLRPDCKAQQAAAADFMRYSTKRDHNQVWRKFSKKTKNKKWTYSAKLIIKGDIQSTRVVLGYDAVLLRLGGEKNYMTTECKRDVRHMNPVISIVHEDQKRELWGLNSRWERHTAWELGICCSPLSSLVKKKLTLGQKTRNKERWSFHIWNSTKLQFPVLRCAYKEVSRKYTRTQPIIF